MDYKDIIKNLSKIQYLEITLSETKILHNQDLSVVKDSIDKFESEIEELKSSLDDSIIAKYNNLKKSGSLAVVEMIDNRCSGCFMSVPVGDVNRMVVGQTAPICPNCSRFIKIWDME